MDFLDIILKKESSLLLFGLYSPFYWLLADFKEHHILLWLKNPSKIR
jgi:hypothetical protein